MVATERREESMKDAGASLLIIPNGLKTLHLSIRDATFSRHVPVHDCFIWRVYLDWART